MFSFISVWPRARRLNNHSNSRPKVNRLEFLNKFKLMTRANMAANQGRILHTCVTEYLCRRCLVFYTNYFFIFDVCQYLDAGDLNTSAVDLFCFYNTINYASDLDKLREDGKPDISLRPIYYKSIGDSILYAYVKIK